MLGPSAHSDGLQGSVYLNIEVAVDGRVERVRVNRGLGMALDKRAVVAVKQWQYKPAPAGRIRSIVEMPFRLNPPGPWIFDGAVLDVNPLRGTPGPAITTNPELHQFTPPDPGLCSTQGHVGVNFIPYPERFRFGP